jgi:hypothetical protein
MLTITPLHNLNFLDCAPPPQPFWEPLLVGKFLWLITFAFDGYMSRILYALSSVRCLGPSHSSRCFHAAKSVSKRQSLIQKQKQRRNADQPYDRRIETGRIKGLLTTIDRYAAAGNGDAVQRYVQSKLGTDEFHNPSRSLAYEKVINSLLGHKMLPLALLLYERMIAEGLLPSLFTRVQMEAMAIVHSAKPRQEVYRSLEKLFAEGSFDDASLGDLITILGDGVKAKYPPETIDRIVKLFIKSQGPEYRPPPVLVCKLVNLLVRNHSKLYAKEWLDAAKEFDEVDMGPPPSPSPHITFLNALSEVEPTNISAQVEILNRMQRDGIAPDTSVYNGLISAQLSQGNLGSAFELYSTLMQFRPESAQPSPKPTLLPDAATFRLMFRAIKLIKLPRGVRSRRYKRPKNAISARQLYGDMVESHLIQTRGRPTEPSSVISPSSIHLALRTFMIMSDYAAAFVIVRSLEIYPISPNLDTYQIVIKGLLRRMHRELGSARGVEERRWADVLLGREDVGEQPLGMTTDMVVQLVQFGLDHRITLEDVPDPERLDDADDLLSRMPSLSLIMGQEISTEDSVYSAVPLQRILRRALLAQVTFSLHSAIADLSPAQLISKIIAQTKRTMVRELPAWVKKTEANDMRDYRSRKSARSIE